MKKNYIIDTNVLILDEEALFKFEDNDVYIPIAVIDEIDKLKDDYRDKERASSARAVNKKIRAILTDEKNISYKKDNIVYQIENGGTITFYNHYAYENEPENKNISPDWQIILTALDISKKYKKKPTVLVTNDNGMANRAMAKFKLKVEEYKNPIIKNVYTGRRTIENIDPKIIKDIRNNKKVNKNIFEDINPNEYLQLYGANRDCVLAKEEKGMIVPIRYNFHYMSHIKPTNVGQKFMADSLLSDIKNTPLSIISGPAGTGKTYLAMACALEKLYSKEIEQILLLRPNVMIDKNDAALPGDEQSKIDPLMRPYWDNLKSILSRKNVDFENKLANLIENEQIRAESFSYIRGRSLSNVFIICDESQNMLRKHMYGLMTRAGENSKLVILGDPSPEQIDNSYINEYNNGLVFAMNFTQKSKYTSQVKLMENESKRSNLVKELINMLKEEKE